MPNPRLTEAQIGALRTAVDMCEIHFEVDEENMVALAVLRRAWAKVVAWDASLQKGSR